MIKSIFCRKNKEKKLLDYGTMFLKDNIRKEELHLGYPVLHGGTREAGC